MKAPNIALYAACTTIQTLDGTTVYSGGIPHLLPCSVPQPLARQTYQSPLPRRPGPLFRRPHRPRCSAPSVHAHPRRQLAHRRRPDICYARVQRWRLATPKNDMPALPAAEFPSILHEGGEEGVMAARER
ncbi:MAG: hypothetical protein M1829_005073 [Trizodia sp. TS-e1964]|nr:MAG: hypothetical protein M1829_005073 [Trizodia sp. TS-e1964]